MTAGLSAADIAHFYPAVEPLATPSDLRPHQISAIVEAVNPLIADAFALYVKTKNFHYRAPGWWRSLAHLTARAS